MCDHCNYEVQSSLHSIHHLLEVAPIFHTLTDSADECVCQGAGCSGGPAKVKFRVEYLSHCFFCLCIFVCAVSMCGYPIVSVM